jgi:2-amino-4-hydroxy-6-hydroxymethyldihydropteridine diphosphokinase
MLVSSIYETSPVGGEPGTRPYLNAVIQIDTALAPNVLLNRLHEIESEMGRPPARPRNAPRTIDLDILYAGALMLRDPEVTVPHPRLVQRGFVLAPLAEIVPGLVLPGQSKSVAQLLNELRSSEQISKIREALDED